MRSDPPTAQASLMGIREPRCAAPDVAGTVRLAVRVGCAITVGVFVVAAVVRLGFAAQARRWLAFPFTGLPKEPQVAAGIFLHNLRALAAVGGLLLITRSGRHAASRAGSVNRAVQRIGEALLVTALVANVVVVGASLGAYGLRMIRAALPHGPLELAAYSLALAVYLQGRDRPLPLRHVILILTLSALLLAGAAALETFVDV